ncbi:MAG TPA: SPFH domain-containing protein [Candidatus Gastranaerophilales bacterium]|nr:SPFH domain-containing protein [Candidatus Gastranaerophilales bacterium]
MTTFFFFVLVVFVISLLSSGIKIIHQAETMIIEKFGKFDRKLESGINIVIPIYEQPRKIKWREVKTDLQGRNYYIYREVERIDLREAVYDFPKQKVITADNAGIEINALIYFQIVDPVRATYEIANLPEAIEKLAQTTLRNVIGELELDQTLVSRDTINVKLREILDDASNKWGVKVNRVELQDITPPKDIQEAMEKQMRAERDKRASILEAEGDKKSAVLRAEGQAEARIKVADAEREAIRLVTEAIVNTKSDPAQYLIAIKYLETLKEMVSGRDNKIVYLPIEATGVLGAIGGIKEMLAKTTE